MCANSLVVNGQRTPLAQNGSSESIERRYKAHRSHQPRRQMSASLRARPPKMATEAYDTINAIANGLGRPGRPPL